MKKVIGKSQKNLRTDLLSIKSLSKCGFILFVSMVALALYLLHVFAEIFFLSSISDSTYQSVGIQQPFAPKVEHFVTHSDLKKDTDFSNVDSVIKGIEKYKRISEEAIQHMIDDQNTLIKYLETIVQNNTLKDELNDVNGSSKVEDNLAKARKLKDDLKELLEKNKIQANVDPSQRVEDLILPGNYGLNPNKQPNVPNANEKDITLENENKERSKAVVKAIEHAWSAYEKYAFGKDEVKPVSRTSTNWLGMGAMILDSIDLFHITGLDAPYTKCREWIQNELKFNQNAMISTFETTIRSLGGLLSIHGLTNDKLYLDKAQELAEGLLKSFGDNVFPYGAINIVNGKGNNQGWTGGSYILAEIGTMQLEFLYLAKKTKNPEYAKKALEVYKILDDMAKENHEYHLYVKKDKTWGSGSMSLGGLGDSFYEYLIKMWLFTGKKAEGYKRMWDEAMGPVIQKMYTKVNDFGFLFQTDGRSQLHTMEHLTCFAGGMFVLGTQVKPEYAAYAESITNTCNEMYKISPTGLSPESINVDTKGPKTFNIGSTYYILRPEALEAIFYMWRHTHNQKYRDWGWRIFQAIETQCKIETGGYSGLRDVNKPGSYDDSQQTFLMAETFKYLYLLFQDDSVIPLDKYVFNTEAHPLPIFENEDWEEEYLNMFPHA